MSRERVSLKPGWANRKLPDYFFQDVDYLKIISFYVFYAFKPNRSSKGKTFKDYNWPKDVWKNSKNIGLKDVLIYSADLHMYLNSTAYDYVTRTPLQAPTFVSCNTPDDMHEICQKAGLPKEFTRTKHTNRIAVYNSEGNIMLSVFDHIRNAFAHGRFTIYDDGFIALESGKKVNNPKNNKGLFDVRSRMLLSKDTLMKWIKIIEAGSLDPDIVMEIERKRIENNSFRKSKKAQKKNTLVNTE